MEVYHSSEAEQKMSEENRCTQTVQETKKVCRKPRKKQHTKMVLSSTRASQSLTTVDQNSTCGIVFRVSARLFPCAPVYEHPDSDLESCMVLYVVQYRPKPKTGHTQVAPGSGRKGYGDRRRVHGLGSGV